MAEEYKNHVQEPEKMEAGSVESTDRGLFGKFLGKKDEAKPDTTTLDHYPGQGHPGQGHPGQGHPGQGQEQVIPSSQFDHKVHVSEPQPPKYEENKDGLLNKLHRSKSSSSSSSEEEVEEGGERRRRKKDKTKKVTEGGPLGAAHEPVEKKGLVNKIKEKIPGQGGKDAAVPAAHAAPAGHVGTHHTLGDELASTEAPHPEEKKGIMEKIKEKLPGYHPKGDEANKDKDTTYNN